MKLIYEMHEALEVAHEQMSQCARMFWDDDEFQDAYHEVCEVLERYENTPAHLRSE